MVLLHSLVLVFYLGQHSWANLRCERGVPEYIVITIKLQLGLVCRCGLNTIGRGMFVVGFDIMLTNSHMILKNVVCVKTKMVIPPRYNINGNC